MSSENGQQRAVSAARIVGKAPRVDETPVGIEQQPISLVEWVERAKVINNTYNPNYIASPELKLLKVSIVSDGWTQPIVCRELPANERDGGAMYEVVDGFHRWAIAADPEIARMTDGKIPIVILRPVPEEHRMASTIRHNRARGQHQVMKMADIIATLDGNGISHEKIGDMLGMEAEEIVRFLDRGNMLKRGSADEFGAGWVPR